MITDFLTQLGRPVVVYPQLVKALGDIESAIFVCQLCYWDDKGSEDRWIYKTQEELTNETGISPKQQRRVRSHLKSLGVLEEKVERLKHRTYYRINRERMEERWSRSLPEVTEGHVGRLPKVTSGGDQRSLRLKSIKDCIDDNTHTGSVVGCPSLPPSQATKFRDIVTRSLKPLDVGYVKGDLTEEANRYWANGGDREIGEVYWIWLRLLRLRQNPPTANGYRWLNVKAACRSWRYFFTNIEKLRSVVKDNPIHSKDECVCDWDDIRSLIEWHNVDPVLIFERV